MQVECVDLGTPVVRVLVAAGGRQRLQSGDHEILPVVTARCEPCFVVGLRDRCRIAITGGVNHPKAPPCLLRPPPLRPGHRFTSALFHSIHGTAWKYWRDTASPTSRTVVCKACNRPVRSSRSSAGRRNSSSLRALPNSREASAPAPILADGPWSSSSRQDSAWTSAWKTDRGNNLSSNRNCTTRDASSAPRYVRR